MILVEIQIISPSPLERTIEDLALTDSQSQLSEANKKNSVEQKMLGVHLVENADNQKGWELFANEAVGSFDSHINLKNIRVHFFNENKSNFIVNGDTGEIDGSTKDIVIRGNVRTESANGYVFKTDTLRYIASKKIMTSLDKVTMLGPEDQNGSGFKLDGEKLLVDIVQNKMSILDKIVTTKVVESKDFKLTSVRADFTNNSREAKFSGDVRMNLGNAFMQAPVAFFNYNGKTNRLLRIMLKQGVDFSDDDKKGSSQELELNFLNNIMTMKGQPKVQRGEDEIKGYEIVFIDGGKKVKINNNLKKGLF